MPRITPLAQAAEVLVGREVVSQTQLPEYFQRSELEAAAYIREETGMGVAAAGMAT
jgi:hypothetical protein